MQSRDRFRLVHDCTSWCSKIVLPRHRINYATHGVLDGGGGDSLGCRGVALALRLRLSKSDPGTYYTARPETDLTELSESVDENLNNWQVLTGGLDVKMYKS